MDIKKINYKSDFTIRMTSDAGWGTAFRVRFRAKGTPQKKYYASHDGNGNFINCHIDENDSTTLVVAFDDHHLGVGVLLCEITYTLVDDSYPTEKYDSVANEKPVKTVINGEEYIVVLDIDGDESAIIVWQLPAFEAEAEREAAEEDRRTAEAARQEAELSRQTAEAGRDEAETTRQELSDHPQYVGEDGYVYTYSLDDHAYHRTDVYLKGEKGDTGNTGPQGIQGPKGDTVIIGDEQEYTLYNGTGQNTDGAMTQKAATDNFARIRDTPNNSDLDIADDLGNVLARFEDGEFKVKNFDTSKVKIETGDSASDSDLEINDENNQTLVRFSDGEIQTKNFNSANIKLKTENADNTDLDVTDEQNNVVVRFSGGHIKTKNFDSSQLNILNFGHPLKNKVVGFLGDSITYGYGLPENVRLTARYSSVLCNLIGCTEVNMGVSGTCIASNTINNKNDTRFVTRVTQANIGDLDFLFVFGGTNDFSYDKKPIGEHFSINTITPPSNLVGSTQLGAVVDTETFSGGLHDLILAIRAINPNLPMCFLTPLSRGRYLNGSTYTHGGVTYSGARPNIADSNINGNYLYEFEDAIVDITRFYAIPSIRTCSFFNNRATDDGVSDLFQGSGDNIHLTVAGNARLAKLLFNWTLNNIVI